MRASDLMQFDIARRVKDKRQILVTGIEYPETISGITPEDVYYGDQEDYHESKIEPIPLAPEILEKNWACKWTEHSKTIKSFNVPIDEHSNISFQVMSGTSEVFVQFHRCGADSCEFRKNIKYVHELQHALRLCGIDKEIVI